MIILKNAVYVHPLPGQDEDTYLIRPLGAKNLYLVFDGVGGHKNGREAADLAKSHFAQAEIRDKNDIIDVILAADADIQMFLEDSFTTITGVLQDSGKGYAFSVGDSPFLHFNPGKQKLYQMLAPHYAKNSTSTLVKALGYGLKPEDIHTREFRFFSGHWYLLASDGLTDDAYTPTYSPRKVDAPELIKAFSCNSPQAAADLVSDEIMVDITMRLRREGKGLKPDDRVGIFLYGEKQSRSGG